MILRIQIVYRERYTQELAGADAQPLQLIISVPIPKYEEPATPATINGNAPKQLPG